MGLGNKKITRFLKELVEERHQEQVCSCLRCGRTADWDWHGATPKPALGGLTDESGPFITPLLVSLYVL